MIGFSSTSLEIYGQKLGESVVERIEDPFYDYDGNRRHWITRVRGAEAISSPASKWLKG